MLEEESVCHSEPTLYTIEGNIHFVLMKILFVM